MHSPSDAVPFCVSAEVAIGAVCRESWLQFFLMYRGVPNGARGDLEQEVACKG